MRLRPRFPLPLLLGLARSLVRGEVRGCADDMAALERALPRRPDAAGVEHVPLSGPVVLVANHYQRPGLWIGWAGAAIACAVHRRRGEDPPVRWTVVEDLRLGAGALPGSRWAFRGIARAWSLVPMPTGPGDVRGRALALRRLGADAAKGRVVGIFPEGARGRAGTPGEALPGVGRWLRRQADKGAVVVPVAAAEREGALALAFGPPLTPAEAGDPMPVVRRLYAELGGAAEPDPGFEGRRLVGRWGRAARLLRPDEGCVLDVGCAFGFGTAMLLPRHRAIGVERDGSYVEQARRRYPGLPLARGDAAALPIRTGSVDAVLLLDVIEHLADPAAAIAEAHRVLRPGGGLVVSVPRRGPLAAFDALNRYARLAARRGWPPLDPAERGYPEHRHFGDRELAEMLDGFRLERMVRTGLGLAEVPHLALLVMLRGLLRWEGAYRLLRFAAFGLAIAEDALPTGGLAYNLTVRAVKRGNLR